MLRKASTILAVAIIAASAMSIDLAGASTAGETCRGGSRTALKAGEPQAATIDNGQVHKYKLTVPAGQRGFLNVLGANGDVDLTVCKDNANKTVVCYSHNMLTTEGCGTREASVELPSPPWNPGVYLVQFGDALPPGDYLVDANHCFSSVDGENCDYGDALGIGVGGGSLDDAPAIAYAIGFVTN